MAVKILSIVETRPGLMKAGSICDAIEEFNRGKSQVELEHVLVHTGRSEDARGLGLYFNDLDLPRPDQFLGVEPSVSALEKSVKITERFAELLVRERPNVVLVIGDVDSALDCALATKRIGWCSGAGLKFAPALGHVEAGLRKFDRRLVQEVNSIVTDLLSDYLFTSEESAVHNLLQEGVKPNNIHLVGSVAVDTLVQHRAAGGRNSSILNDLQLCDGSTSRPYALITLRHLFAEGSHEKLARTLGAIFEIAQRMPVVFPAPPELSKHIHEAGLADYFVDHFLDGPEAWDARVRIRLIPPLGYFDFIRLMNSAKVVFTDSGGVQVEARFLGVPCITLADNTTRPVTLESGANVLAGTDPKGILEAYSRVMRGDVLPSDPPWGWDGLAARRIVDILWNAFRSSAVGRQAPKGTPVSANSAKL